MNTRPRTITVLGWLFIAVGAVSILNDVVPLVTPRASEQLAKLRADGPLELGFVWAVRALAVLGGAFVLYGFNWARWLLVAWMAFHVAISVGHPLFELLVHTVLFAIILYFLFRAHSSAYFRSQA